MKKIDKLVVKAFLGPFFVTFFIALFVLIMQFLWKYIDDLVGKGLELSIIAELIFYLSASVVPLALPIAVLLSSIMTLGNLGEHYELVALKSAGVSLLRFIAPLMVIAAFLSVIAFGFSNYVLPVANLKFYALLHSVTRQRPALNIKPGIFYDGIDGYVIRVGSKDPNSRIVYDVKIHDHTQYRGNKNVLLAEKGEMYTSPDENFLIFKLFNGYGYEETKPNPRQQRKFEFVRRQFKEYEMIFDLSAFGFEKTNENLFRKNHRMLNVKQLLGTADSLQNNRGMRLKRMQQNFRPYFSFIRDTSFALPDSSKIPILTLSFPDTSLISCLALDNKQKVALLQRASNMARSVKSSASSVKGQVEKEQKRIIKCMVAFHEKITLSLACFVLFLIGAPLGALIRKGGLGMPMVIAIIFFTIFHILSTTGKKIAEEAAVSPFLGMWGATFILFPLGIFLIYKAMNDSALFNLNTYLNYFKKIGWLMRILGALSRFMGG